MDFQEKEKIDKENFELVSYYVVSVIRAVPQSPECTAEGRCTALCPKSPFAEQ